MNPTFRTALAVVCIVVIAVCAILIVGRVTGRARVADLTEHKLYTLSQGTRNIVDKLNQPVKFKLYYGRVAARKGPEMIRFWNNYFLYVRDILREYVSRSGGKLSLEIVDPRPYSDEEQEAMRYGLKRFNMPGEEIFFFGLVASTELGKEEVLEVFDPERQEFVEYDVSRMIVTLVQTEKRKVGVIANVPIMGTDMSPYMMQMLRAQGRQPERPWGIVSHLGQRYEVEKVDLKEAGKPEIPDDIEFLMVVHPKGLDEKTQYAIDQYVMKGGRLMVFVDPHCFQDRPMMQQPQAMMSHKSNSDLNDLLERWGVRMEAGKVAIDRGLAITVAPRPGVLPEPWPTYLNLGSDQLSKDEKITEGLHHMQVLFPGSLAKVPGADTDVRPLIQTSATGNTWKPDGPFALQMFTPSSLKDVSDGSEPIMLACVITGKFKTNFPGGIEVEADEKDDESSDDKKGDKGEAGKKGDAVKPATKAAAKPATKAVAKPTTKAAPKPGTKAEPKPTTQGAAKPTTAADPKDDEPKEPEKKTKQLTPVTEAAEGAVVIVVADVDMLHDMTCYRETIFGMMPVTENPSFVLNTLDYLSGSSDLIQIRSRGKYRRPFKVVDDLEREAKKASAEEIKAFEKKKEDADKELSKLGGGDSDSDIAVLQDKVIAQRRKLKAEAEEAEQQIRRIKGRRREKVEALGDRIKFYNMAIAPFIILAIAGVLALIRWLRAKHYAARRD